MFTVDQRVVKRMASISQLAPWIAIGFQALLFVSIESWEMKVALFIFVLYQIWKKSK